MKAKLPTAAKSTRAIINLGREIVKGGHYTDRVYGCAILGDDELALAAKKIGFSTFIGKQPNCYHERDAIHVFRSEKKKALLRIVRYQDWIGELHDLGNAVECARYEMEIVHDADYPTDEEVMRKEYLKRCNGMIYTA